MRPLGLTLAAVVMLCACGSGDKPRTGATKPAVTPFPSIDMADVAAGTTYTTRRFKPDITLTVPAGEWKAAGGDSRDHVELEPTVKDPVDVSALAFHHMTQVFDSEKGGVTPRGAEAGPDDFAKWLSDHPHLRASKPRPVEALGLHGISTTSA